MSECSAGAGKGRSENAARSSKNSCVTPAGVPGSSQKEQGEDGGEKKVRKRESQNILKKVGRGQESANNSAAKAQGHHVPKRISPGPAAQKSLDLRKRKKRI